MLIHKLLSFAGKIFAKNKLSILIYHQVFAEQDPMRVSEPDAEAFRWQMELIKKYYTPLSISEALAHLDNGTLPANAVCITFDDGYINNLEVAAPILNALDIPATVYVATAFSNGENMWNDRLIDLVSAPQLSQLDISILGEDVIKLTDLSVRNKTAQYLIGKIKYLSILERKKIISQLYQANGVDEFPRKMMSPAQIKQLHEKGIEIGAHTVDHPILKVLSVDEQLIQIKASKQALADIIGTKVKGFAYPNGKLDVDYDSNTRDIVEQLDFEYAVSTNWGFSIKQSDKFQLKRFTPWDKTPLKFHLRLIRNLVGK
ncbi:MAG: polysaccharide deacetylase family protein [Colwellia sp.]|nr:polysaccharide deacetylase family protein [Colwellia sp.]MCW9080691.1 polysaccharide deacetylase family protein [Colwellia sp.]